ncbi:MAG: superoxide dismutase, Ni [Dehalococcoidia bacterium]
MVLSQVRARAAALLTPSHIAHAHCDIPCGIYDPHTAQLAANTVMAMVTKIQGLAPDDRNNFVRMVHVKEEHAEVCKKELQILWSDYFKPEHLEKYPDLHDKFWKALKLGSKNKQNIDAGAAQQLIDAVAEIANIFWETKGQPAPAR